MGWELLIPIIVQYGLPVAEAIWKKAASGADPVQADWDELNALAHQMAADRINAAAARAGLSAEDPRVLALLNQLRAAGKTPAVVLAPPTPPPLPPA